MSTPYLPRGNLMNIEKMAIQRVLEGVRKYGVIDLGADRRCFRKEAVEELLDSLNGPMEKIRFP